MRKFLLATVAAAGMIAGTAADAAPITGQVSFIGNVTVGPTTLTFQNPLFGIGVATGSFLAAFGAPCISPSCTVTMTSPLTYSPNIPSGLIWTATDVSDTATFTTLSAYVPVVSGGFINISAPGQITLTGYDVTDGLFELSIQSSGQGTITFSATTAPVPEPATLAILGMGLLGLAGAARSRKAV